MPPTLHEKRVRAMMDAAFSRAQGDAMCVLPTPPTVDVIWQRVERRGAYALLARALLWFGVDELEECSPGERAVLYAMLLDRDPTAWLERIPTPSRQCRR